MRREDGIHVKLVDGPSNCQGCAELGKGKSTDPQATVE
jgi:hypothetical protein